MQKAIYTIGICLFSLLGKTQAVECYLDDNEVFFTIKLTQAPAVLDSLFNSLNTGAGFADSLVQGRVKTGVQTAKWKVYSLDRKYLTLKTSLSQYAAPASGKKGFFDTFSALDLFIVEDLLAKPLSTVYSDRQYGFNSFSDKRKRFRDGMTYFYLEGHEDAREVYVAGTFNQWNYLKHPMRKTEKGWVLELGLKPGKHLYKFVVDGHWQLDPENKRVETDFGGNDNNPVYITNKTFRLEGYPGARQVYVASSFNEWKEKELRLQKKEGGWEIDLYVPEGTHAYKFIVDGHWLLDPENPIVRKDQSGIPNSFLAIGDTFYFELNGYREAKEVFVSGNFNAWQERELTMHPTDRGWRLPYVLAGGNYQYKLIVDGRWMLDPGNPHKAQEGAETNSLLAVKPNHVFKYPHRQGLRDVRLSGSFNGWSKYGYTLKREGDVWRIPLHLGEGKQLYKFIVEGKWELDPNNPLWEQNEFGTGNSVLWME